MNLVSLDSLFDIEYGNQLDLNKMTLDKSGVNFISRSRNNLGVAAKVKKLADVAPYDPGLITVTLGGTYLLSSFVQPSHFYTAQNIKVLKPKYKMTFSEKLYYCKCIESNRFKYSSHGREANKSLDYLLVPDLNETPKWAKEGNFTNIQFKGIDLSIPQKPYNVYKDNQVPLYKIFDLFNGVTASQVKRYAHRLNNDFIPFIRPSKTQRASYVLYVNKQEVDTKYIFPAQSLYISTNGQGSHTFSYVSNSEFVPNSDVTVLVPNRKMSLQEKLFYALAISSNRFKFSYGRKPKGNRLKNLMTPEYPPTYVYRKNYFKEEILKHKKKQNQI